MPRSGHTKLANPSTVRGKMIAKAVGSENMPGLAAPHRTVDPLMLAAVKLDDGDDDDAVVINQFDRAYEVTISAIEAKEGRPATPAEKRKAMDEAAIAVLETKGETGAYGDLYAKADVRLPTDLTQRQIELLEELRELEK